MSATVVGSLLGLFGLWIAVYYLWRDYRNDSYREDIFSVRDEMFLFAANCNIPFDHPAYTLLRTRMNGLLRHGPQLTLTRLLILLAACKDVKSQSFGAWQKAVAELPEDLRERMKEFNLRVNIFVLQHLIFVSFFRYLVFRPLSMAINIRVVIARPHVETTVERLESATVAEEDCELVPA
jgi:hypothetical protein